MPADRTLRILLVDDEPTVRVLLTRALREEGYEVVAVADGQAGLDAAQNAAKPYDLIITNSYMPHMHGEELIAHLRQLFPYLPILHLDDLSRELSPDSLAVPTLYKPFRMEALLARFGGCLTAGSRVRTSNPGTETTADLARVSLGLMVCRMGDRYTPLR